MKNLKHYLKMFESAGTAGRRLIAEAIYAGRYGSADNPDTDVLRDLTRELPDEPIESSEAIRLIKTSSAWREFLKHDPIPPWALRLGIQAAGMTQVGLAEKIGVDPRTVRRYLAGEIPMSGSAAVAARLVLG